MGRTIRFKEFEPVRSRPAEHLQAGGIRNPQTSLEVEDEPIPTYELDKIYNAKDSKIRLIRLELRQTVQPAVSSQQDTTTQEEPEILHSIHTGTTALHITMPIGHGQIETPAELIEVLKKHKRDTLKQHK